MSIKDVKVYNFISGYGFLIAVPVAIYSLQNVILQTALAVSYAAYIFEFYKQFMSAFRKQIGR